MSGEQKGDARRCSVARAGPPTAGVGPLTTRLASVRLAAAPTPTSTPTAPIAPISPISRAPVSRAHRFFIKGLRASSSPSSSSSSSRRRLGPASEGVGVRKRQHSARRGLIAGVLPPQREEAEEVEEADWRKYTDVEFAKVHSVHLTQRRAELLVEMEALLLGERFGQPSRRFNAAFASEVRDAYDFFAKAFAAELDPTMRFDMALAFTMELDRHDAWAQQHAAGWQGDVFLPELAALWKQMLAMNDSTLGITQGPRDDVGRTRRGVRRLLQRLKQKIEDIKDKQITFHFE